jgi:5'-methylthioadenosine phosphorylase
MATAEIGVIGGSGLYALPQLTDVEEIDLETPWGEPSDEYMVGTLCGRRVAFLARHGRGHRILPSELNFQANIYGFKMLGVERILSFSAVGSLKEEHAPLSFILPDQFVDRTRRRIDTFFGGGIVAHVPFADPICSALLNVMENACKTTGVEAVRGGTYVCMEGPAFSTKAESNLYRSWGMDVIGMTNLQEAKLAREAELCYVTVAMVTDYDCWHPDHDSVTVQQVMSNLAKNSENAIKLLLASVSAMPRERTCRCGSALAHAIVTEREKMPHDTLAKIQLLISKYIS